jgi:hypothetical protein
MNGKITTLRSNKDRLVYLLAEYKYPLSITALAVGVWVAWASPKLPTPTQRQLAFATIAGGMSLPSYFVGLKIARYLFSPDWVHVGIANPGEKEIYDGWKVPPEMWGNKTVLGANPLSPDEGLFDYIIVDWHWYEELGELEVRGVAKSDMTPAEALRYENRVDEYYNHHHDVRRAYSHMKSTVQKYATEIHDATIMGMMEEREKAELAPGVSATDLIEEMESEMDDLPDGPQNSEEPQPDIGERMSDLELSEVPEPEGEPTNGHKKEAPENVQ